MQATFLIYSGCFGFIPLTLSLEFFLFRFQGNSGLLKIVVFDNRFPKTRRDLGGVQHSCSLPFSVLATNMNLLRELLSSTAGISSMLLLSPCPVRNCLTRFMSNRNFLSVLAFSSVSIS